MRARHEKNGTREERRMARRLRSLLEFKRTVELVETFEEAGVLTRDCGLVIRLTDGTKFQITIVEDRRRW